MLTLIYRDSQLAYGWPAVEAKTYIIYLLITRRARSLL